MLLAAAGLALLNLWRWWPTDMRQDGAASPATSAQVTPDELRVSGLVSDEMLRAAPRRDLFAPGGAPEPAAFVPIEPAPAPPEPQVDAEARAMERARRRLGEYRLEGTLERRGERQAFLAHNGEVYCVGGGERLADGIVVDAVGPSHVVLRDTRNAIVHTLSLGSAPGGNADGTR